VGKLNQTTMLSVLHRLKYLDTIFRHTHIYIKKNKKK
jgi:hypothetical protein